MFCMSLLDPGLIRRDEVTCDTGQGFSALAILSKVPVARSPYYPNSDRSKHLHAFSLKLTVTRARHVIKIVRIITRNLTWVPHVAVSAILTQAVVTRRFIFRRIFW